MPATTSRNAIKKGQANCQAWFINSYFDARGPGAVAMSD